MQDGKEADARSERRRVWRSFGETPRKFNHKIRLTMSVPATHGAIFSDTQPCERCGCVFVNVGCPKIWPIGTVMLTCSECGRTIKYVDGLLIMSVVEAIQNLHGREWAIRRRLALELSEARGVDKDIVMLALDQGMTMEEIVTALDMESP